MFSKRSEERSLHSLEASSSYRELLKAHYQVLKTIRKGGFAPVRLARHLLTNTLVAVKVLDKRDSEFFPTEVEIFKSVDHPNITKLYEVIETEDWLFIVMEYLEGGDLSNYLKKVERMREEQARPMFQQILRAVKYCHDNGIAHRDLKAENILLDGRGQVKLCDFGLSTWFLPQQKLEETCGTLAYWAPEMFNQQRYQGPKVDVWSLGVLLYYMVMGDVPYPGTSWIEVKKQVLGGKFLLRKCFSPELRGLLAFLMTFEPKKRPTVRQVMHHPWLRKIAAASSSPSQTLLDQPDPAILNIMSVYFGFEPGEVRAALDEKKFNAAMATYLILQDQQDGSKYFKRLMRCPLPGPPPCPSPAHPSYKNAPFRRASAPVCHPAAGLPAEQQEEEGDRKVTRSVCLPCLLRNPCMTCTDWETEGIQPPPALAAAAVCLTMGQPSEQTCPAPEEERHEGSRANSRPLVLYNTWTGDMKRERAISSAAPGPEGSDTSWKGSAEEQESNKLPPGPAARKMPSRDTAQKMEGSKPPPNSPAPTKPTESPANEQLGRFQSFRKNIINCFRRLCCCCVIPH
ncbi:sperm motility kinase 4A-like [Perognathus longimembris pacificus]|uniref:sperm motility kinase 4A-like n=1 Tax=Perognathus longimembris pacificus TaxID=214514 RepID=UPI00201843DC|nr:sperm motility kinase 4A-like [Perognathus longimembris pacificus]